MATESNAIDPTDLRTIDALAAELPSCKVNTLRYQVLNRHENGLASAGACVRVGRRILISRSRYASWLGSRAAEAQA